MRREEVLAKLTANREELRRMGARSLALFGSFARDEAGPNSDVDVLVDLESPATFDKFMDLKFFLEDLLGRPVDLVTRPALGARLGPAVERHAVHVA